MSAATAHGTASTAEAAAPASAMSGQDNSTAAAVSAASDTKSEAAAGSGATSALATPSFVGVTTTKGDEWVAGLARGERASVWGLALNVASPPPPVPFRAAYEALADFLRRNLPADEVYVYGFEALHVTVATLVTFTSDVITPEERGPLKAAWAHVVQTCAAPTPKFELTAARLQLGTAAGILLYDDPSGEISHLRARVKASSQSEAILSAGGARLGVGFRVPDIIHTSFVRFPKAVTDIDKLNRVFQEAAEAWKAVQLPIDEVVVVVEDAPYMHIPRDDAHVVTVVNLL